jgi:hypothetical protein
MGVKKLYQEEAAGEGHVLDRLLKQLFIAWVRNKVVPISFMLQAPKINRPAERIRQAIRTVYELGGHFCYDDDYDPYFFHLISVLERLPNVTLQESRQGMKDLTMILKLFQADEGFELNQETKKKIS